MTEYTRKISIIVPVYNEEENIPLLVDQVFTALNGIDFEMIMVDDGSTDKSVEAIEKINSDRIKLVEFRRNYGQSAAMSAGIQAAEGEYLATIDGDLQNDPSDIPWMLKKAEEEKWDLVAGTRAKRKDGMFLRKIPSKIANRIIQNSTGIKIKDYGCTLKVFKSDIAKDMGLYGELHRFIPVLASLIGARITQVDVKHHPRKFGVSKYGMGRTFKVVSDLLLMLFFQKYFPRPIHLFGNFGLAIFGIGAIIDIYLLVIKLMGNEIGGRPLLLLGVLMTLAGIQFITFGIMAELMMRTYYESQNKTPYKIRRTVVGKEPYHKAPQATS